MTLQMPAFARLGRSFFFFLPITCTVISILSYRSFLSFFSARENRLW